jgi:serine/threonine-protein kinase
MKPDSSQIGGQASLAKRSELGKIIDRFEDAWRRGERPDINRFLADSVGKASTLAVELIHIDLEYRLKARDAVRVEEYLARFPWLADDPQRALELLTTEYRQRRRYEPELTIDDYLWRFPQWREALLDWLGVCHSTLSPAKSERSPLQEVSHPLQTSDSAQGSDLRIQEDIDTQSSSSRTAAEDPILHGTSGFGRYKVLRPHAKGGLGEVLVAEDAELKRNVALKRIQERFAHDAVARQRFLNEAEITAKLEHPGIVPIYGLVYDDAGQPSYAMRFIQGESLAEAIRRFHQQETRSFTSLPFRQLLQRFISVCETMAYAHSKQVIHRDLKPANIMLGDYGETLVVDWGLARELANGARPSNGDQLEEEALQAPTVNFTPSGTDERVYTQAGQVLGTLGYMAPEQAAGRLKVVGSRSDIYCLGATLYELLTGQRPIGGQDRSEALQRAQAGRFPVPRVLNAKVPRALEAICIKAMAFEPSQRYATAEELARDVEHWLADELVSALAEAWPVKAGRWLRKHRTLSVGIGVLMGAAIFILVVVAVLLDQARLAVEAEKRQTALQRDRAQENLALARKNAALTRAALDNTVTKVAEHKRLKEADFLVTRKELLELAIPAYEELVKQQSDDPELEADRGRAYHRLAFVREEIGENRAAIDNYQSMARIFAKLVTDFPSRPDFRRELATSYNNLGILLRSSGRLKEAESAYADALAIQKQLAADHSSRPEFGQDLARSHINLGLLFHETRRLKDAELAYAEALAIFGRLAAEFSTRSEFREELAASHNNLGNLFRDTGRLKEAESAFANALTLVKQLAADFPTRSEFRQELAGCHNNLSLTLRDTGRLKEAESALADALAIQKQLAADFPSRPDFRQELAASYGNLGILLQASRRLKEAESAHAAALAIQKQLAAEFPSRPDLRQNLAMSHDCLGDVLHATGRLKEAESAYADAVAIQKQLAADFPTWSKFREDLARSDNYLGLLLRDTGRLKEAESALADALAIQKQLAADFPKIPDYRNNVAGTLVNLANLARRRLDFSAAHQRLDEAVPYHQAALQANPLNPIYRQFFRNNLLAQTSVCAAEGDLAGSFAAAKKRCDLGWDPPDDAYDAACALAVCIPIAATKDQLDETKRQDAIQFFGDKAMAMLHDAVTKGYKDIDLLRKDDDLKALRQRRDYQKLVQELEAKP